MGAPPMNLLAARLVTEDGRTALALEGGTRIPAPHMMREARELWCGIRPEDLSVVPPDTGRAGLLRGDVIAVEPLGPDTLVTVGAAGQDVLLRVPAKTIRAASVAVTLAIDLDKLHLFDRQSGIRLA